MSSHARFEAVKAFVSTRGGFDHLADHAEDHGIGLTVYVEEDVYAAMREVADRRGATHARHWRASDCKLRPPRRNPK